MCKFSAKGLTKKIVQNLPKMNPRANSNYFLSMRRGPGHLRTPHDHDLHPAHHGHPPLLPAHGSQSSPGVSSSLSSTLALPNASSWMQLKALHSWPKAPTLLGLCY